MAGQQCSPVIPRNEGSVLLALDHDRATDLSFLGMIIKTPLTILDEGGKSTVGAVLRTTIEIPNFSLKRALTRHSWNRWYGAARYRRHVFLVACFDADGI